MAYEYDNDNNDNVKEGNQQNKKQTKKKTEKLEDKKAQKQQETTGKAQRRWRIPSIAQMQAWTTKQEIGEAAAFNHHAL